MEWIQNSVVRPHQASYLAERETETRDPGPREPMGFLIFLVCLLCKGGREIPGEVEGGGSDVRLKTGKAMRET